MGTTYFFTVILVTLLEEPNTKNRIDHETYTPAIDSFLHHRRYVL